MNLFNLYYGLNLERYVGRIERARRC